MVVYFFPLVQNHLPFEIRAPRDGSDSPPLPSWHSELELSQSLFPPGPISRFHRRGGKALNEDHFYFRVGEEVKEGFEREREMIAEMEALQLTGDAAVCPPLPRQEPRVQCLSRRWTAELLDHCRPFVRRLGAGQAVDSENLEQAVEEALWVRGVRLRWLGRGESWAARRDGGRFILIASH